MKVRVQAAKTLAQVLRQQASLQSSFEIAIQQVAEQERGFFHELVYGTLRQYEWLDTLAQSLLKRPFKTKDADLHALVLLGLYQLYCLKTPDHAAVSETVAATKHLNKLWARGAINGILRNAQRQAEALQAQAKANPEASARCPRWLLDQLQHDWPDHWPALTQAAMQQPPLCLRVNEQHQSQSAYHATLAEHGIASQKGALSGAALYPQTAVHVPSLPGFTAGHVSVQDEAAQLAAFLLDAQAGERILDACAAPGGKTAHILEHSPELEALHALELDPERAERLKENLERLSLTPTMLIGDASQPSAWWDGQVYDRILLDAPCSATGVIRRHPDIKRLRQASDIPALVDLQSQILDALWRCLKPGGTLLYATCSILNVENSAQIDRFLSRHEDAQIAKFEVNWGVECQHGMQLLPTESAHDGFYYAKLIKST